MPAEPCDFVIFGGSGDLALRKLLPALYQCRRRGELSEQSRIIAIGSRAREGYLQEVERALGDALSSGGQALDAGHWSGLAASLSYLPLDARGTEGWDALRSLLAEGGERTRVFYLATPPDLFGTIAAGLAAHGMNAPGARIVLEKPVGNDYRSAQRINNEVGRCFDERSTFRIDHYLGKQMVRDIPALRFDDARLEPLRRSGALDGGGADGGVDHVQITVAETLGVGNRTGFYEGVGALRDMVQNHMLQLLCLVAMERPASLAGDALREEKLKVLGALRPITGADAARCTVRAQYLAGSADGQAVPGYQQELGAPSDTETFAAIELHIDNARWAGVPFYLRTGKRLGGKYAQIGMHFRKPHALAPDAEPFNWLSINLQPDEAVHLAHLNRETGAVRRVALGGGEDGDGGDAGGASADAYERMLMEVQRGNQESFVRRDEIETAWQWIDGIADGWRESGQAMETYAAGSPGPAAADALLARSGRIWVRYGDD